MSEEQWKLIKTYLTNRLTGGAPPPHLLVVSCIPLVYLNFAVAERFLDWFPWRQDLEDDLQISGRARHTRRSGAPIMTLLDHAAAARTRVSILSGDVHVGARGRIASRRPEHLLADEAEAVIHQLTSSAIVYPPPGPFALAGMRTLAKEGPSPLLAVSHVETASCLSAPNTSYSEPTTGSPSSPTRTGRRQSSGSGFDGTRPRAM